MAKKSAPKAKKAVKKVAAKKTSKAVAKTARKAVSKAVPAKAAQARAAQAKAPAKPAAKAAKPAKPKDKDRKLTAREKRILKIRDRLMDQKDELLSEAENAVHALPDQTIFPDQGDQASVETDRNFMLRLKGREQRLLKKIDEAIERIESGTYGICEICGEEIRTPRLEARPVTTMCIDCKTEQEEEEKLQGS